MPDPSRVRVTVECPCPYCEGGWTTRTPLCQCDDGKLYPTHPLADPAAEALMADGDKWRTEGPDIGLHTWVEIHYHVDHYEAQLVNESEDILARFAAETPLRALAGLPATPPAEARPDDPA